MHELKVPVMARAFVLFVCVSMGGAFAGDELPEGLLAKLKSERFQEREAAEKLLIEWSRKRPEAATESLYRHYQDADDPEQRERCLAVIRILVGDQYFAEGKGFVGVVMKDSEVNTPGKNGERIKVVRVADVLPGFAASKAGVMIDDCITGLDGKRWGKGVPTKAFEASIKSEKPGTAVTLNIIRAEKFRDITVVLGRRPLAADDPRIGRSPDQLEAAEDAAKEAHFQRWLKSRSHPK